MADPPDEPPDGREARLPLQEHVPMTVAEAGLDLPVRPDRRRWKRGLVAAAIAAAVLVPLVWLTGRETATPLGDLDVGDCFTPAVTDLSASVDDARCEPGALRVAAVPTSSAGDADPYPGEGALTLFGQGACQSRVAEAVLVVAVPSPADWADGERTVVCAERLR